MTPLKLWTFLPTLLGIILACSSNNLSPDPHFDAAAAGIANSPSGDYVVVNANWCNDDTGGTTTDRLRFFHSVTGKATGDLNCGYGLPSHQDLGYDANGDQVIVGIAKSGPWAWENVIMRRLHTDRCPLMA